MFEVANEQLRNDIKGEVKLILTDGVDEDGNFMQKGTVRTDANGAFNYTFKGEPGKTYNFAYIHEADTYYTYLRDTYSNRSIVKVNVNDFIVLNPYCI